MRWMTWRAISARPYWNCCCSLSMITPSAPPAPECPASSAAAAADAAGGS